jgi:hypothetical protein
VLLAVDVRFRRALGAWSPQEERGCGASRRIGSKRHLLAGSSLTTDVALAANNVVYALAPSLTTSSSRANYEVGDLPPNPVGVAKVRAL